ncbi:hypothetical protein [Methylobacterium sp.]|uniref:hypothetical protein n=1 Tax=Methylobacterium sp. TaxID=409 RepID=UPI0025ED2372|nr:hypothetical protein [Methylobacterium sp.]MBY0259652.1 hypothetical protein [Methylobacterium sp.]
MLNLLRDILEPICFGDPSCFARLTANPETAPEFRAAPSRLWIPGTVAMTAGSPVARTMPRAARQGRDSDYSWE